jgi:hypothetical protein
LAEFGSERNMREALQRMLDMIESHGSAARSSSHTSAGARENAGGTAP